MSSICVELTNKLSRDLERICSDQGKSLPDFIASVVEEKVTLIKYGDLNDIMNKFELQELTLDGNSIVVSTNRGSLKIKVSDIKKVLPKEKKKKTDKVDIVPSKENNVLEVKETETVSENIVSVEVNPQQSSDLGLTRKMRIL